MNTKQICLANVFPSLLECVTAWSKPCAVRNGARSKSLLSIPVLYIDHYMRLFIHSQLFVREIVLLPLAGVFRVLFYFEVRPKTEFLDVLLVNQVPIGEKD